MTIDTTRQYQPTRSIYHKKDEQTKNVFLGVAFTVEKPVHKLIKSFWNVLASPVDSQRKAY